MSQRGDHCSKNTDLDSQLNSMLLTDTDGVDSGAVSPAGQKPLYRNIAVNIATTLDELTLNPSKNAVWSPSKEQIAAILRQPRFQNLQGDVSTEGDLRSILLHKMSLNEVASTWPLSIGMRITGVDNDTFTLNGSRFATVVPPDTYNSNTRVLQEDDISTAHNFAKAFPGYTSNNISTKGVTHVDGRHSVLLDNKHPIVYAIGQNAVALQANAQGIAVMEDGLVKCSTQLYEKIMPSVKQQIESQVKVRNFENMSVSMHPADFDTWTAARAHMLANSKKAIKAKMTSALVGIEAPEEQEAIRLVYRNQEKEKELEIGRAPMSLTMNLGVAYSFL